MVMITFAHRSRVRNSPGSPGFKWRKWENVPRKFGLTATPGVKVNLCPPDSPHEFIKFLHRGNYENHSGRNQQARRIPPRFCMRARTEVDTRYSSRNPVVDFTSNNDGDFSEITPGPALVEGQLHDSPFFYKHIPRDRYDQISTCFHFSSDDARDGSNRLWKLGCIVELLQQSFKEVYVPPQWITVDESQGRGVLLASHKAVADLMESAEVLDKGYSLYVDNWYSSPTLFHWLHGRKTNARANRKFMPKDFPNRMRQNQMERRSTTTGMLCMKWADKKHLYVLSTMHTSAMVETDRVNRKGEKVIKPQAVIDYKEGMKGVDFGDQLASSYPAAPVYSGRDRPAGTNTSLRLQGRNPHSIVETEGKRYKRCHVCYTHGKRKMTKAECKVCRVALCVFNCFEDYHNKLHH
ncbi:piggyBac transposable element-derived protein 4-like [Penaeus japonicus]|uniref:piggyBac transposable element-derived protein 4-like n=1 Tax=Penaeus japonicus TaxID=27405 RepID=UPI001C70E33D|nr:piggyBac transposable element-derived protein 4-like [Penaeus japonicus]